MYKLSPSKAHRYLNCTKSLEFDTEFVETAATMRGNMLHKLGEMFIFAQRDNEEWVKEIEEYIKQNNVNDYELFLVKGYEKAVWEEYIRIGAKEIQVEQKRPVNLYGFSINLIMDVYMFNETVASIIDLKTGNGDVDAVDNEQLIFYAFCALSEKPELKTIRTSIFQKGKMKTVVLTSDQVLDFFVDKADTFEQIKEEKLAFNPSDKACKFCEHKHDCVARAKWILNGKK
jgi:hypothetical protein